MRVISIRDRYALAGTLRQREILWARTTLMSFVTRRELD
jgi:hypothetical protein